MLKEKCIIQICIALSILLLPVAHLKVNFFGLPLYSVEIPILVAFGAYVYGWWSGTFSPLDSINICNPLFIGIALFFFGAILSFVTNPFTLTGLGMLKTWFVIPLSMVWLWIETKPVRRDIDMLLFMWFISIAIVSLLSIAYLVLGVLTYDNRLTAWYSSPNYLAFFLAPGVLLAHYFYFHQFFSRKKIAQVLIFLELLLLIVVLFFTHAYGTWVSVVVAGLIFLFLDTSAVSSWRKKAMGAFLLLTIFGTFLLFESNSEKWHTLTSLQERSSLESRITIWHVATKAIADHPFLGIGIGRFQEVYLSYQQFFPPYLEWAVPQPHNLYLALWLQTGIIGLFGFGLLVVVWLKELFVLQREPNEDKNKKKLSALLIALLSFYLVLGLVDTPFFKTDLAFIFWFIIALGLSIVRR
jgi:O-antigen ligase